jgi:polar amino acid transport system permease protein
VDRIAETFFNWGLIQESFPLVLRGFGRNVALFMVAEVCVLVWALALALMRGAPGRLGAPLRWFAVAYVDVFRGLPALVVILLVAFGLPLVGLRWPLFSLAVLALTLVYGAYVAEVYRAGIESVHHSQTAAARSLGLSGGKTMRFVVLPQAVRRVIPPLLNDFIGLQKDTALVGAIGLQEGLRAAQIFSGQRFNASPYIGVGLCFLLITIPLARFTDRLLLRQQRRVGG